MEGLRWRAGRRVELSAAARQSRVRLMPTACGSMDARCARDSFSPA